MNTYHRFAGFDLETTGIDPLNARIVTASLLRTNEDTNNDLISVSSATYLLNPDCDIPQEASDVHGVTTDMAREHGLDYDRALDNIINDIYTMWDEGRALVVYNAAYDLTILKQHRPDFTIAGPILDPYVLDKHFDTYRRGRRTCMAVAEHYGFNVDASQAHRSEYDCHMAMYSASRIDDIYDLPDPESINDQQSVWYDEMQASLRQYFETLPDKDPNRVTFGWPFSNAVKQA